MTGSSKRADAGRPDGEDPQGEDPTHALGGARIHYSDDSDSDEVPSDLSAPTLAPGVAPLNTDSDDLLSGSSMDTVPPPRDSSQTHSGRTTFVGGAAEGTQSGQDTQRGAAPGGGGTVSGASTEAGATVGLETVASVGRRLGDFELQRKLGQGGMGEVWLATQLSLARPVAVKVLPKALGQQAGFIDRFRREARSVAQLVHPHVVQTYASGIQDGTAYFAMEYVEGEDLQQMLRRQGALDFVEAGELAVAIASALGAAHEKGLIHRDVKPSNVMLDRSGAVKVMDFGLAKTIGDAPGGQDLTQSGLIMGTPNYLSPEQGRGDTLDGRSDLYSMGVVFYEMLTGAVPFRSETPAGLIFKHVYEPPPPARGLRPDLPPFLEEVLDRLLEKDRDQRYASADEVLGDLHEFLDHVDHYVGGGARRPEAGSGRPRRSGVRRRSTSQASDRLDPYTPGVGEAPPASRPLRRRRRSRLPLVVGAGVVVVGSLSVGGLYLYKKHPEVLAGWGVPIAVVQPEPLEPGGGGEPTPPTPPGREPVEVPPAPTGPEVAWRVPEFTLEEGVTVALVEGGEEVYGLDPGTERRLRVGRYVLRFSKAGYEPLERAVALEREGEGARLVAFGGGGDPWAARVGWEPAAGLVEAYAEGLAGLEEGRRHRAARALGSAKASLAGARESLERARGLDGGYRPTPESPSVEVLLGRVQEAEGEVRAVEVQTQERLAGVEQALQVRRWRVALESLGELEGWIAPELWERLRADAVAAVERGDGLAEGVSDALGRGSHREAQERLERLEEADPGHPRRAELEDALGDAQRLRAQAFAEGGSAEGAIAALEAYLARWEGDLEARQRLEALRAEAASSEALGRRVEALREAVVGERWEEVLSLAERVVEAEGASGAQRDEASRAARDARAALLERALARRLVELDAALTGGDAAALVALCHPDGPAARDEVSALRRLSEVEGRFERSAHEVVGVESGDGERVVVRARWRVRLSVLGRPAEDYTIMHQIEATSHEGRWAFWDFAVEGAFERGN